MPSTDLSLRIELKGKDSTQAALGTARAGLRSISEQLDRAKQQFIAFKSVMLSMESVRALVDIADQVRSANARLRQATGSIEAMAAAQRHALRISAETGAGYEAIATLYTRLSLSARDYGLSQERIAAVTEVTARALKVSNAGASESASVVRQLSQALGAGVLRGDEFNSIMENGGRLAQALADGLGVPIGALRALAEQGLLTTDLIVKALESQRTTIEREAAAMPDTIGRSLVAVRDQFAQTVARMDETSGASAAIARAFAALARNLDGVVNAGAAAGIAALAIGIGRASAAVKTYVVDTTAKILVEQRAAAAAIAHLQVKVSYASAELAAAQAAVASATGMARLTVVQSALVPAQQRLAGAQSALNAAMAQGSLVTRGLSIAMGLVGGPLGLIVTLLTAGATAWAIWGSRAETAGDKARAAVERAREVMARLKREQQFGTGDAGELREGIARLEKRVGLLAQSRSKGAAETLARARKELEDMQQALARVETGPGAPGAPTEAGRELMRRQWDDYIGEFKTKTEAMAAAIAKLREKAKAAGVAETSDEFKRALANLKAKFAGEAKRDPVPRLVESFDAEFAALKTGLKTAEDLVEASFKARYLDEESYWEARAALRRQALDLEERELVTKLADQERAIAALSRVRPQDASERQEIAQRISQAQNKAAELRSGLDALAGRRVVVDVEIRAESERLARDIAEAKAKLAQDLAQATGTETPEQRRAGVRREYQRLLDQMAGDAQASALIERLIDVKAAQAEMSALERQWSLALENMRNAEQSANIQAQQGLITQGDAQARIAEAHRGTATEMDQLLPKLEAAANAIGPEAVAKVAAWKNELASVQTVADPLAASLDATFRQSFEDMFVSIGQGAKSAKEAFLDFARSVIGAIQRIAAQKIVESLFGSTKGGGLGTLISGIFQALGFASGGYVRGPGTSTSDSIPARLSAGEYVIRAEAVRRFGVAMLDAINGLRMPPVPRAGGLAFAAGGLVEAPRRGLAGGPMALRIVNTIDPAVMGDYLATPAGERVVVNVIRRNASSVRQIMGA